MSAPEQTPPTAVPTPSSAPSSEPKVTTLHQGNLERQRELLKQKLAEKKNDNFTSPTDSFMTPVSKKLSDHKKKGFAKTKPTSLGSRFAKALAEKGGEPPKTEAKEGALFGK